MMNVLITGKSGYIASKLVKELENIHDVDSISLRGEEGLNIDFSSFDVLIHTAGIAHVSYNESESNIYDEVNYLLTMRVAEKAKQASVKQFIFMSSMLVYGESQSKKDFIDENTPPQPTNPYGKSKYHAEKCLLALQDDSFKVVILRLPMVYGPNSQGNYPALSKFAKQVPIFINVKNKRSMIYIEHLTKLITNIIDTKLEGIYYPQNNEAVSTSEIIKAIRKVHNRKTLILPFPYWLLRALMVIHPIFRKVFGSQVYKNDISRHDLNYTPFSFLETIRKTEGNIS